MNILHGVQVVGGSNPLAPTIKSSNQLIVVFSKAQLSAFLLYVTPYMTTSLDHQDPESDEPVTINEPRLWVQKGWTARVIKNEDDDGWAVEMILDGEPEPALVGPWTMGRDKKNPKPLDANAFNTLVKTASEVVLRHEQQLQAQLHKTVTVIAKNQQINVALHIVLDEDDPHALLSAHDRDGTQLAQVKVRADLKLNTASAQAWIESGYDRPK
jgi:hypothetical protein